MIESTRRLHLMLLALPAFLLPVAAFNWIVDPYAAWGSRLFDLTLKKELPPRVATPYRLHVEQPEILLVGTSRVFLGMPIEQGYRDGILNAAMPGETIDETVAIVDVALRNPKLKRLIWGADFVVFNDLYHGFQQPEMNMPLRLRRDPHLMIRETLLSLDVLEDSRALLSQAFNGRPVRDRELPALPWPQEVIEQTLAQYRASEIDAEYYRILSTAIRDWIPGLAGYRLSKRSLELFSSTIARAHERGIAVTFFSPPLSEYELELIRQVGQWETFLDWKRALAAVDPYWDFAGYTRLSAEDKFFLDPLHFKPAVGQLILRCLLDEPCTDSDDLATIVTEAATRIDAAGIEDELARQDRARAQRLQEPSRYRTTIASILAANHPGPSEADKRGRDPLGGVVPLPPG